MHHVPPVERRKNTPQQPLTQEQLDWITEQNRRAASVATRRTLRTAAVGYLILAAGAFGAYWNGQHVGSQEREAIVSSGRVVAVEGCNRDFKSQQDFVDLLKRLKQANTDAFERSPKNTDPQALRDYTDAQSFYAGEITTAMKEFPDCRKTEKVVTSDPDDEQYDIKPLFRKAG